MSTHARWAQNRKASPCSAVDLRLKAAAGATDGARSVDQAQVDAAACAWGLEGDAVCSSAPVVALIRNADITTYVCRP